ncbi:MAG: hypothetical protein MJY44_05025 [Bacteroidales bacterium]|nr:hypothetical protein [Bacteroidales bacterium]
MEKNNYLVLEDICRLRFNEAGICFHVCTQENIPLLFRNGPEFKAAMNVVALACLFLPKVKLFTFCIMDNHLHFLAAGEHETVLLFARTIIRRLAMHPLLKDSRGDILRMKPKLHKIESLANIRNVIAYIHRNGPLVNSNETVFSYEWGAGRFFFNREVKARFRESGRLAKQAEKRALTKSHYLDRHENVYVLDGYISPMCYCSIQEAEHFFTDARQYFYKVSKNIESQKDVATLIGEQIYYSDYDLNDIVLSACKRKYGVRIPAELNSESKIDLAKMLHYDYNASKKQITRLLKIQPEAVSMLFP